MVSLYLLLGGRSQRFGQVYTRRNRQDRDLGQDIGPVLNNSEDAYAEKEVGEFVRT